MNNSEKIKIIKEIWKKESELDSRIFKKMYHSERVANYMKLYTNYKEYELCGWVHDIGRIEQFKQIGCFDDNIYNHANAGIDYVEKNQIKIIQDSEFLKDAILYHSNYNKYSGKNIDMISVLTSMDQLDNALECKEYLLEEERIDNKHYIKDNYFSKYYLDLIKKGDILADKKKCKTYIDYFYFAYTLLLTSITNKQIKDIIAKKDVQKQIILSFDFFEKLFKERIIDTEIKEKILYTILFYKDTF